MVEGTQIFKKKINYKVGSFAKMQVPQSLNVWSVWSEVAVCSIYEALPTSVCSNPNCVAIQCELSSHSQLHPDCSLDRLMFPISRAESLPCCACCVCVAHQVKILGTLVWRLFGYHTGVMGMKRC